nr:MAG TPA: hypothetical protein [Caudoviricetes sp.]
MRLSHTCSTNCCGVGWRDAIGAPFVCVLAGGVLTYRTVPAVSRECLRSLNRTVFVGP